VYGLVRPNPSLVVNHRFYKALGRLHGPWCKQHVRVRKRVYGLMRPNPSSATNHRFQKALGRLHGPWCKQPGRVRKRGFGKEAREAWKGHVTEQEIGRELSEDQIHLAGSTYIYAYIRVPVSFPLQSHAVTTKGHSAPFFRIHCLFFISWVIL
jgi:hypothetical protein